MRFGENLPKTEYLIKRMDRPLLSFNTKITAFVTYADLNSMATNVVFRQSLLKLEMYLWKYRENRTDFSLMIIHLSRTGIIFIQMLRSMIFLSNKGLIKIHFLGCISSLYITSSYPIYSIFHILWTSSFISWMTYFLNGKCH